MNPICPRCKTVIYHAEQMTGPGGAWHKTCLTCKECNRRLDSTNLTERDSEAYCKICYNKAWGPRGYGYAGGASFLTTETRHPIDTSSSSSSSSEASLSEWDPTIPSVPRRLSRSGGAVLTFPFRPAPPEAQLDSPRPTTPPDLSMSPFPRTLGSMRSGGYIPKKLNFTVQKDVCRGCGKAVYAAEAVLGAGHKYHKLCLKCTTCGRMVDATNMVDRESKLYCRGCYAKEFGPRGYGYAGGAAFLSTGQDASNSNV